jgi:predicted Holliday junction resolvase-like endonuclease
MLVLFLLSMLAIVMFSVWSFNKQLERLKEDHKKELQTKIAEARKDAKKRSSAVQWGLTIENFAPFLDDFPIPTEDVTFLGKPIDYVGYTNTDSKDECEVHFIEVKSGRSQLLKHQRNIKEAIKAGRVNWHEIRVEANIEK